MAKTKLTGTDAVTEFIAETNHPLKHVMEALRHVILTAGSEVGEHIKWNAPAFYYSGEMADFDPREYKRDIVVYNVRKNDSILLVFPTGARVEDDSGLLEGSYADGRRMVTLKSMDDLENKKATLQQVIRLWLEGIER